jgi:Tfp pilus assembly protein PilF
VNRLEDAAKLLRQMPSSKVLDPRKHKIWGDIFQRQGLFKEAAEEYRAATLLAAEEGDTLEDLAELDAFLEQDEERWEDVLEPYSEAAERRISEAQTRRRDDLRSRRASS